MRLSNRLYPYTIVNIEETCLNFLVSKFQNNNINSMKLLTYNFLTSAAIKGVKIGYPLKLHVLSRQDVSSEFNAEFLSRMIPRLEWGTVLAGAMAIGYDKLPLEIPNQFEADTDFLQKLHHVLLEIDITDGHLECPETGRKFPISNGIPNMLLNEDEV